MLAPPLTSHELRVSTSSLPDCPRTRLRGVRQSSAATRSAATPTTRCSTGWWACGRGSFGHVSRPFRSLNLRIVACNSSAINVGINNAVPELCFGCQQSLQCNPTHRHVSVDQKPSVWIWEMDPCF